MVSRSISGVVPVASTILASFGLSAEPEVPKEIAVPSGYKVLLKVEARGVQIYKAIETKPGELKWALEGPLADRRDGKGTRAGFHYEGPSWEATDGSKVVRDKSEDVKVAEARKAKEDLPWLLVKLKPEEGKPGVLTSAAFVQRLETSGGLAPTEAPSRVGTKVGVPYQAVYVFYSKAP
jgi:hypothetical protein